MDWKTYQMIEEIGERVEIRRGHRKGYKRGKKRNFRAKMKQNGGKEGKMSYNLDWQWNGRHTWLQEKQKKRHKAKKVK